jgi:hypothetical protein
VANCPPGFWLGAKAVSQKDVCIMKYPNRFPFFFFLFVSLATCPDLFAEDKKTVEFQGIVSGVDLAARTIAVQRGSKHYVFQIDIQRCNIVKDGDYLLQPSGGQPGTLGSAKAGDAVVGELTVESGAANVTKLYLTTKPETAVRVKVKPGFVISPYHSNSQLSQTSAGQGAIDVRGYQRGSMLVDRVAGKIFLVP